MPLDEYESLIEELRDIRSRDHCVDDEHSIFDRMYDVFHALPLEERHRLLTADLDPCSLSGWWLPGHVLKAGENLPPVVKL